MRVLRRRDPVAADVEQKADSMRVLSDLLHTGRERGIDRFDRQRTFYQGTTRIGAGDADKDRVPAAFSVLRRGADAPKAKRVCGRRGEKSGGTESERTEKD